MEIEDKGTAEEEHEEVTVDFSKQTLKRIERANNEQKLATALILDHNEIQRLDNLDSFSNLRKLSLVNNQLIRMYGVSQLVQLESLNLSHNSLVTIEGLKELKELKHLTLANNRIKTLEHLNNNLKLLTVDLSENNIMHISDISYLQNLRELQLHGNKITYLRQCERNLPESLEILTLNNNCVGDLNEVSHLVHLTSLKEFSIANNPCVNFSADQKLNYRPFVKNWCSSLIVLDSVPLNDIECLKAEWLYSQGRGRSFRPGEHGALMEYLISVCPREAEEEETEDVKKLKLILSKAQQHQQQLREQLSTGKFNSMEGSKPSQSRRKIGLPERMVTSFQDSPSKDLRYSPELMTRSLDSGILKNSHIPKSVIRSEPHQTPLQTSTTFIPIPDTLISPDVGHSMMMITNSPRPSSLSSRTSRSSSRNSIHSTPEFKRKTSTNALPKQSLLSSPISLKKQGKSMSSRSSTPLGKTSSSRSISSPGGRENSIRKSEKNYRETSEEEDSEVLALKILAVQQRANQRKQNKSRQVEKKENLEDKEIFQETNNQNSEEELRESPAWKAAVCIQRRWRGYRARNLNGEVLAGCKNIQMSRMQDYITKVVKDMEATRIALEGNRKLVVLQIQAVNALWKKMAALHPPESGKNSDDKTNLQNLMETCSNLNKQMEMLQAMMKTMQNSSGSLVPIATQTEIVAVHTPQGEGDKGFPYTPTLKPRQASVESHSSDGSLLPVTEEGISLSVEEATKDSDADSTSDTVRKVKELHSSCKSEDVSDKEVASISESQEEKEVTFFSEKLTRPSLKLGETPSEILVSPAKELENENREVQNGCNS